MMPYVFIVFLLFCSAFFSSTEIAFASVNKTRLKQHADDGSLRNKWALEISETKSFRFTMHLIKIHTYKVEVKEFF